MWTQISTRYPEAALTCLERSLEAPLTFVIDSRATLANSKDVVDRVLPQMDRMRHIYIPWTLLHDDDGNVSPLVSGLIDAPAPQLETFYLYRVRADGKCFALPPVFGGSTPRLTVLKLSYSYPQIGSVTFGTPPAPRMIPGLGTGVRPQLLDESFVDDVVHVAEVDTVRTARRLVADGFVFGGSTGTVVCGAARWLERNGAGPETTAVALAPDLGERYLDTVHNEQWVSDIYGADAIASADLGGGVTGA